MGTLISPAITLVILLFFCFPDSAPAHLLHSFKSVTLPSTGNEAYAFDADNGGPYTGLNDGRIVKYLGPDIGFQDFAITSPNRTKKLCDGTNGDDPKIGPTCGRPIGLEFNHKTRELYVTDAYSGLMVVGSGGGVAIPVAGEIHFDNADGIDVDPITGDVYVTDLGTIFYKTHNMTKVLTSGDKTGRLIKYNPKTKQYAVVMTGLQVPNGVAVSRDGSFVLVAEYIACRIMRFWLKGPKANTSDIFTHLPGNPDNIKRTTSSGDFWVPVNIQRLYPQLTVFPLGQKIDPRGRILETVNFYAEYNATYITEVQENHGYLYVASVYTDIVGVYGGLHC